MKLSRMIDVGNERIRISKIKKYMKCSGVLYIRNEEELRVIDDHADGLGFIEKIKYKRLNRHIENSENKYNNFWEEISFDYVHIPMFDGSTYDVCSDKGFKKRYDRTIKFISSRKGDYVRFDNLPEDMEKAEKLIMEHENLTFVDYNILSELDMFFKAIK